MSQIRLFRFLGHTASLDSCARGFGCGRNDEGAAALRQALPAAWKFGGKDPFAKGRHDRVQVRGLGLLMDFGGIGGSHAMLGPRSFGDVSMLLGRG